MKVSLKAKFYLYILPFVIILPVLLYSLAAPYTQMRSVFSHFQSNVNTAVAAQAFYQAEEEQQLELFHYTSSTSAADKKIFRQRLLNSQTEARKLIEELYKGYTPSLLATNNVASEEKQLLDNVNLYYSKLNVQTSQVIELSDGGKAEDAFNVMRSEMDPLTDESLKPSLEQFINLKVDEVKNSLPLLIAIIQHFGVIPIPGIQQRVTNISANLEHAVDVENFSRLIDDQQIEVFHQILSIGNTEAEKEELQSAKKEFEEAQQQTHSLINDMNKEFPLEGEKNNNELVLLSEAEKGYNHFEKLMNQTETYAKQGQRDKALDFLADDVDGYIDATLDPKFEALLTANTTDVINSINGLNRELTILIISIYFVCIVVFVIGVVSLLTLSRTIITPVIDLRNATSRITAGDLSARVHVTSKDEIGQLANAFNTMTDRLQTLYKDLEEKVNQRTNELTTKISELEDSKKASMNILEDLQKSNKQVDEERVKLKAILDNMGEGLVVADKDGKFTSFNKAAEQMLGIGLSLSAPEEWSKIYGVFLPDKETPFPTEQLPIVKALAGEETHDIEQYIKNEKRKEGIFISVSGNTLRDKDGQIIGSIAVFNNITKRKETELRLFQEKAKDEAILESIGDGIIVTDKEGRILLINHAAELMLGWTLHEMVGKTISEVVPIEDEKHIPIANETRPLIKTLVSGKKTVGTYFYERRDKTKLPIALTVAPVVLSGTVIGAIEVFRDVTHEKELEQLKDEFVSVASHELRTPMTAINGLVAMIKEGDYGPINEGLKEPLHDIADSTQRLIFLVNDLLNVSRIEAGRVKFALSTFSLTDIIKEAVHLLQPIAKGKGTKLEVDVVESTEVQADSEKVKQILNNLLGNALKFTDKGQITVIAREMKETVIITVTDTGMGISSEDQAKLFGKFQQISSQQVGKPQGTGLGLYISQQLARKMGGDLWIDRSELGQGSTFAFSLPRADSEIAKKAKEQLEREAAQHPDQR